MEHIQKYKIEDESLDDQPDNFVYSHNSYSNNITSKNSNNFSKIPQNKTIKITHPKIQISDLGVSSNKKSLQQNAKFTKSDINQNFVNMNKFQNVNINANFKSTNNSNINNIINNFTKQEPKIYSATIKEHKNININNDIINNFFYCEKQDNNY